MANHITRYSNKLSQFLGLLIIGLSAALPSTVQSQVPTSPVKAFDVVSIRPAKPADFPASRFNDDGVQLENTTVWTPIMMAWFPQPQMSGYWTGERIQGLPDWARKTPYDLLTKADAATTEQWKGLRIDQRMEQMKPMLQTMLAERFKLVLHTAPAEVIGYALVLQKGGPKFKEATPGAELPKGVALLDGGVLVPHARGEKTRLTFFGASMASVASRLNYPGHPVLDQTGLTGKYDLELPGREDWDGLVGPTSSPDPSTRWQFDDLGLAIKPVKIPTVTLVIDHIEPPTPN